jgi:hypothetical protein
MQCVADSVIWSGHCRRENVYYSSYLATQSHLALKLKDNASATRLVGWTDRKGLWCFEFWAR